MNWTWVIVAAIGIVIVIILMRARFVPMQTARDWLHRGAIVIDVRSLSEWNEGHLPNALHIPLGELRSRISDHVPDKNTEILLHCLSGGRSGLAVSLLRGIGYRNVQNLGSLSRARKIVGS